MFLSCYSKPLLISIVKSSPICNAYSAVSYCISIITACMGLSSCFFLPSTFLLSLFLVVPLPLAPFFLLLSFLPLVSFNHSPGLSSRKCNNLLSHVLLCFHFFSTLQGENILAIVAIGLLLDLTEGMANASLFQEWLGPSGEVHFLKHLNMSREQYILFKKVQQPCFTYLKENDLEYHNCFFKIQVI